MRNGRLWTAVNVFVLAFANTLNPVQAASCGPDPGEPTPLPTSGCDLAAFHAALTRLAATYQFVLCEHAATDAEVATAEWIPLAPVAAQGDDSGNEPTPNPGDLPAVSLGLPAASLRIAMVRSLLEAPEWQEALRRCVESETNAAAQNARPTREPAAAGASR